VTAAPDRAADPGAPTPARIVLVGFMGCGKSTVGRILARRLGRAFVDTDGLVEERAGRSIARIFAEDGEAAFRDIEAAALRALQARKGIVAATGGGAPAQPRNAWFFGQDALTFHLRVSLAAALQRARHGRERPLLQRSAEEVRRLYEGRLPLYEALGPGIDTDRRSAEEVAGEIVRLLGNPTPWRGPGGGA
jgi:shikimate kinase